MKIFSLLLFIFLFLKSSLCANEKANSEYRKYSQTCMGTKFNLLIDEQNILLSNTAAQSAFKEAHRLDRILSDYNSNSELSILSQNSGSPDSFSVSDDLFYVLACSQELAVETEGAFDITIGPLSRLWRIARFKKVLPTNEKRSNAQERMGYQNLKLDYGRKEALLLKSGMVLDLGGIAKGYAADRMFTILMEQNVTRFLIDAGGDILLGNPPRGKAGWKISIGGKKHPDLPNLVLANVAIATSGDLEQSITFSGNTYSHLINPKTGIGLTTMAQVTVIAPNATQADSLASASLVLGSKEGIPFLEKKPGVRAFFLEQKDNETVLQKTKE